MTHFYEWADAGFIEVRRVRGSMHLSKTLLRGLYFGFDQQNLYLRLDPTEECLVPHADPYEIHIHLSGQIEREVRFACRFNNHTVREYQMLALNQDNVWEATATFDLVRVGSIIEVAVPFTALSVTPGQPLWFVVHIMKGEMEEDRFPKNGRVLVYVPDANYDSTNWSV